MKSIPRLNYINRIVLSMLLSIILNLAVGRYLKKILSENEYDLTVKTLYNEEGTMEMYFDSGNGFNQEQRISQKIESDSSIVQFHFNLKGDEHLKFLRLDFGSNKNMQSVEINSIVLTASNKTIFELSKKEIARNTGYLRHMTEVNRPRALFGLETKESDFDPYLVLKPINELIFPKWQRTLLLVLPWLVLFVFSLIKWLDERIKVKDYLLILVALFTVSIPLKIAWATFTTLLLLVFALLNFYKKREVFIAPNRIAILFFFFVPLLFIGKGGFSKLNIPLGFVFFVLIGSLVDFGGHQMAIKKTYIAVFCVVMSILITNWILLMCYHGYYYDISLATYFSEIKTTAHQTVDWLFNAHTTFLSFFVLIGAVFSYELYKTKELCGIYMLGYAIFSLSTLLLLGSRFSLILLLLLPFMFALSAKNLYRVLLPVFLLIFAITVQFITIFDAPRAQLWKMTWISFLDKPWLGHGTGTSEAILQDLDLAKEAGYGSVLQMNHSHNQFLTYLLENGLIGLIVFLIAYVFILGQFTKENNKMMLAASGMILFLMIIESPFRTTTPLYVIAFLFAVFSANQKRLHVYFRK